MAKSLAGAPVFISPKRHSAGLAAHKKHGTNFFILDDGFQHISLRRDLDLVLMDSRCPFGNGHLLPWGPLREPIAHLRRADAFILTRAERDLGSSVAETEELLKKKFPDKPVFSSQHLPDEIIFPYKNTAYSPDYLKGKRVVAFAGIARPVVFRETLRDLDAEILSFHAFRDHHRFAPKEIERLVQERRRLGADCVVTTEKDWVRAEPMAEECPDLAYLRIRFAVSDGTEDFFLMVKERAKMYLPPSLIEGREK
jgi:tetraacyldisaccharide 4'-kinase